MSKIVERSQVDDKYKWSINNLFESDKAWQEAYDKVEKNLALLNKYKNKITI